MSRGAVTCEIQLASGNAITVNMQDIQCQLTVSRGQFLADKRSDHGLFKKPMSWKYFEAAHGKGVCDGIGGALKA